MKRASWSAVVLLLAAFMALRFAQMASASGANIKVHHTVIAASGDATPAGGKYLPFSFFNVRLNARHEVAFDAFVGGPPFMSGVFVWDGKMTSTVALGNNPDPAAPSFGFPSNPFIAPDGDVVFNDELSGNIFRSDGKTIVPLVRDGDPAPGAGTLTQSGGRAVNDHGVIAYTASVSGATATQGIFRSDGTQTVAIALNDIAPPTGGRFTSLFDPVINDRGQVAFKCEMAGGSGDFGIFRGEGGELMPVFIANQIAPGGATFADFGNPAINRHGQVATFASLTNGTSREGLFVGDGAEAVAIALEGQAAPKGGIYRLQPGFPGAFLSPIRLNDRGELAFPASLTGGTNSSGIFRGNGERTTPIALAGTTAPGTTGTFEQFRDLQLLNDGRVAFIATLTPGVGGVTASNNMGIWVGTSDEDLQLVVRTGEAIEGKMLTSLPQFGQGNLFDMNENGLLWVGGFGPVKAVVLSQMPGDNKGLDIPFQVKNITNQLPDVYDSAAAPALFSMLYGGMSQDRKSTIDVIIAP